MSTAEPHPDVTRLVDQFAAAGVPPYHRAGVLRARAILDGVTRLQGPPAEVGEVRDVLLAGEVGLLLPARVYHSSPGVPAPLVVYLHGGGWALGGVRAADRPCRALAAASGCVVVSLEYRRAPETRFPGPLLDCVAAVRALADDPAQVGADGSGVVLLGDSAGANLAAGTSVVLGRDVVAGQVLVYPVIAPAAGSPHPSMTERSDGPLMTRAELEWFWGLYLARPADATDPRAAPLHDPDPAGRPPTHVVVAGLDPLRDEGLAYAAFLAAAGVPTGTSTYPGAAHGFWWMDAVMAQARELTTELAGLVRTVRQRSSENPGATTGSHDDTPGRMSP